jgi:hypothetical protein
MSDLKAQHEEKIMRLKTLVDARSKAYCSSINSSEEEVKRETEIEELEEEIQQIEKKLFKKD